MSDINFDCPKCGQNLDAPPDLAGLFIECPSCATIIKVPTAVGGASDVHPEAETPEKPTFVAPAPKAEDKGSTMRIDLPPEFHLPPPTSRKFTIKRPGHS
ncbi:MAG TPA: hypothetical protein PKE12_14415 [Kiritimatiellia bacterium]|nr:hypothetical protein [Kiritimatiellia bacterium]